MKNSFFTLIKENYHSKLVFSYCLLASFCGLYYFWIKTLTSTSIFLFVLIGLGISNAIINRSGLSIVLPKILFQWYTIFFIAAFSFVMFYLADAAVYGRHDWWHGWSDQGYYYRMARDLANFEIVKQNYLYGLGYPILGAMFYKVFPENPFFIPNLILYSLTITLYYKIARSFINDRLSLLTVSLIILCTIVPSYSTVPWNNIVSISGLSIILYFAVVCKQIKLFQSVVIGLVLGWVFAARYADIFFLLPFFFFIYLKPSGRNPGYRKYFIISGLTAAVLLVCVLYSHKVVFGSFFKTPYHLHGQIGGYSDQSLSAFQLYRIPEHLYSIIINPYQFNKLSHWRLNTPLLGFSFFFVIAANGFSWLVFFKRNAFGWLLLGTLLASFAFYGSIAATNHSGLKYDCLRYFAMWFPVLCIMAVLGFSKIVNFTEILPKERKAIVLGTLFLIAAVGLNCTYLLRINSIREKNLIASSDWKAFSNYSNEKAKRAIDGDMDTRWSSGISQTSEMYFMIDMREIKEIDRLKIYLGKAPWDYPNELNILGSLDGKSWRTARKIKRVPREFDEHGVLVLSLPAFETRFIKLVLTGPNPKYYWTINELGIYAADHKKTY